VRQERAHSHSIFAHSQKPLQRLAARAQMAGCVGCPGEMADSPWSFLLLFLLPLIVLPIVIVLLIVLDGDGFKAALIAHVPWLVMTACSSLYSFFHLRHVDFAGSGMSSAPLVTTECELKDLHVSIGDQEGAESSSAAVGTAADNPEHTDTN
jgi:hypothetical protein